MLIYQMPAEWEKHAAVWLAWPYDPITFPPKYLQQVENSFVEAISALHSHEDIELLVLNSQMQKHASGLLEKAGVNLNKITFHITDYADVWLRDYGPMFVSDPKTHEQAWVKWTYNAYSNKFPDLLKDNQVFFNLRGAIDKRMLEADMVLEGGSIEQNGQGTILTTEQCLLNAGRNPQMNKLQIEKQLKTYLGAKHIVWLKQGLVGDHTDGHIDELARFVSPNKILCAYEENEADINFKNLNENYKILQTAVDQDNKAFELVKLPMPKVVYDSDKPFEAGQRAAASYTNFYIGNKVVLVPAFNEPNDAKALEIIQNCFPDRQAVAIDCSAIIYGGGGLHCMTQQQPLV